MGEDLDEVAARGKKYDDSKIGVGTPVEVKDKSGKAHKGRVVKVNRKDDKVSVSIDAFKGRMVTLSRNSPQISIVREEVELDEVFDFVLLDKDNKIAGRYSGKDAKKAAESGKRSAHLPPMSIPKGDVKKMKIVPIAPKDKKGIGDTVLAIGEEDVQEGTWLIPKGVHLKGLKKLLTKPLELGKDGDNAIDAIGNFIGDDELYDDLYAAGKKNSKGDARPVIKAAMKRLGIKEEKEIQNYKITVSDVKLLAEKVLGIEVLTENIKF